MLKQTIDTDESIFSCYFHSQAQENLILFTNTIELNRLGFGKLTMRTAIFHSLYFDYICGLK